MFTRSVRSLCWRLFALAVLGFCLIALESTPTVRAVADSGGCSGCGTNLDTCYFNCDHTADPASCYPTCLSTWGQCVSGNCYNLNPFPEERSPCTGRYNIVLRDCSAGIVDVYQNSYDACISQGGTLADCCDLIAMMAY